MTTSLSLFIYLYIYTPICFLPHLSAFDSSPFTINCNCTRQSASKHAHAAVSSNCCGMRKSLKFFALQSDSGVAHFARFFGATIGATT